MEEELFWVFASATQNKILCVSTSVSHFPFLSVSNINLNVILMWRMVILMAPSFWTENKGEDNLLLAVQSENIDSQLLIKRIKERTLKTQNGSTLTFALFCRYFCCYFSLFILLSWLKQKAAQKRLLQRLQPLLSGMRQRRYKFASRQLLTAPQCPNKLFLFCFIRLLWSVQVRPCWE